MRWGFVNMHETPKWVLINNFYFFHKVIALHIWSASNMLLTIHIPLHWNNSTSLSDGQAEPKMDEKNV